MTIELPQKLFEKYSSFLGKDVDLFINHCKTPYKAIRINTLKIKDIKEIECFKDMNYEKVIFLDNCYKITSNVVGLGNCAEQLLGFFQMQELSSMLPVHVLDPKKEDIILDMSAAPGNKTSFISEIMKNQGLIVANDIDANRSKKLIYTLKKNGVYNTVVTCNDALKLNFDFLFDKVLLDAPCSSEGFFLKKNKGIHTWSQKIVLKKAILQKKLIKKGFDLLKPNGVLVYSTCTLSPEENEEVIDFLLKNDSAVVEDIDVRLNVSSGLTSYNNKKYDASLKKAIRIYPHKTNLECFFVCKLRKK